MELVGWLQVCVAMKSIVVQLSSRFRRRKRHVIWHCKSLKIPLLPHKGWVWWGWSPICIRILYIHTFFLVTLLHRQEALTISGVFSLESLKVAKADTLIAAPWAFPKHSPLGSNRNGFQSSSGNSNSDVMQQWGLITNCVFQFVSF